MRGARRACTSHCAGRPPRSTCARRARAEDPAADLRGVSQYLAHVIEQNRLRREQIQRGFTVLNKMARASQRHPQIRQMLVCGPLEYIVDASRARALARKHLSAAAQSYLDSLCE